MYLFARTSQARPERMLDAVGWSVEIAERVRTITGHEVRAWAVDYGAPINTITWTTRADSHAEMGAMGEKLLADAGYLEQIPVSSELFAGAPEDTFSEVLATNGDPTGDYDVASVVTARCAPGRIGDAMAWGLDIFQHVGEVTGGNGLFLRSLYGPWATVAWVSVATSLDEVDAATAKVAEDASYLGRVDAGGPLFEPGSAQTTLSHRLR